jgi:hypothetical protein
LDNVQNNRPHDIPKSVILGLSEKFIGYYGLGNTQLPISPSLMEHFSEFPEELPNYMLTGSLFSNQAIQQAFMAHEQMTAHQANVERNQSPSPLPQQPVSRSPSPEPEQNIFPNPCVCEFDRILFIEIYKNIYVEMPPVFTILKLCFILLFIYKYSPTILFYKSKLLSYIYKKWL